MELKTIQIDKVLANFSQPREQFEKEKIQGLAESILSNGLINPISVRVWKDKYMIVAGERRWRACKVAGLKTIQVFVKEYKNDGEWMVESLIENVHREDLSEYEKAKYLKKIMDIEKIETITEVSQIVGLARNTCSQLLDLVSPGNTHLSKSVQLGQITEHHFRALKQIENKKDAEKVLEKVKKENLSSAETEKLVPAFRKAQPEVKKALLNDEINVEQAERISKLQKPEQREKAIHEHKMISMVEEHVERNIKNVETAREKREFDKGLIQAKNWIASFRGSVTDFYRQSEKTLKILLISTKFIPLMDDNLLERLHTDLDRLIEISDKVNQLAEQIEGKIK